ncbi:short-chain dehydrogenase/reductase SDR [Burkholderia sp. H160]|nr:short-chain dehydrogenase/reductase SDR [Burkholderia sp. H160]
MSLKGKTLFITGGSRGIGLAIAERAARDGANVTIAAKTVEPDARLAGTIHTAVAAIEKAGGCGLAVRCDIREEELVQRAVAETVERFGGIDIVVNNASAIQLTGTLDTTMKRFDLMHGVDVRGTFLTGRYCIPHLKKAVNPHILTISPPLEMQAKWFAPHVGYSIAKYGMSLCTLGWAEEFKTEGIAANSLWPRTSIATAAVGMIGGDPMIAASRKPDIMADAAYYIVTQPSRAFTGRFCIDDVVLYEAGVRDFSQYAAVPGATQFYPDIFLPDESPDVG